MKKVCLIIWSRLNISWLMGLSKPMVSPCEKEKWAMVISLRDDRKGFTLRSFFGKQHEFMIHTSLLCREREIIFAESKKSQFLRMSRLLSSIGLMGIDLGGVLKFFKKIWNLTIKSNNDITWKETIKNYKIHIRVSKRLNNKIVEIYTKFTKT